MSSSAPLGQDSIQDYQIYRGYDQVVATAVETEDRDGKDYSEAPTLSNYTDGYTQNTEEKYASWCAENESTMTVDEINEIFEVLGGMFGFQKDNVSNMFDHFMVQLDSRSSRMSCQHALLSLHIDYIGGDHSNYKKWYFAAHYDIDENVSSRKKWNSYKKLCKEKLNKGIPYKLEDLDDSNSLLAMEFKWKDKMNRLSDEDRVYQIALYLLVWGEANNVRFMPECLCFVYKCVNDYLHHVKKTGEKLPDRDEFWFLDHVITPLYNFIRDQQYNFVDGAWRKNKNDHNEIIGYDDVNQFFWYPDGLKKIKLVDGSFLIDIPKEKRISSFPLINWSELFYKTYKEKRTWLHLFTNFSRVWIIHITMFWYYTSFNSPTLYTINYIQLLDNQPPAQVQLSVVSLGSLISCIIAITSTITEWSFVPRKWPASQPLIGRLILLILLTVVNTIPAVYIFFFLPLNAYSRRGYVVSVCQFIVSLATFLYLAIQPPSQLFNFVLKSGSNVTRTETFTSSFPKLGFRSQLFSYLLWICVFSAKFFESYFFLTLSLRDPIRVLSIMEMRCAGDPYLGNIICKQQAKITLFLLYITDLVLFFLDTYLWYIICNCIFSVGLSFSLGISIFSPWRNIFSRLPERILTKIISTKANNNSISLISEIWNSIILSMYREHLISIDQVNRLVYQKSNSLEPDTESYIRPPLFFVFQDDNSFSLNDFFAPGKEAERRISFFAQSLSSPIPEVVPTEAMPSFTVLIPHYSEKIILSLKEVIKESKHSKVSLLEYLKHLHPNDWDAFVKDTKILQLLSEYDETKPEFEYSLKSTAKEEPEDFVKSQIDDLPFYCIGFKNAAPEYTQRTRIWASLRYQTLYRTISGFMNYETAIKLLYRVENRDIEQNYSIDPDCTERELNDFVKRKFNLLISMQRYQYFTEEENDDFDLICKAYPNIKVAYLEEEVDSSQNRSYYSVLLDTSRVDDDGKYAKKYRIKLSGNPILGDGKSDNQNHAIVFYRGEYIQVIDANQDNYLEECLKIKSVLSEFEEIEINNSFHYVPGTFTESKWNPVAILGAREYIFSENTGILGDIAAGKEQTFGTLFARTLAEIGGKLHYGHPDFLNGIFMTTRGGISKAQKGLHLNEDIYAGMTAICRGGRIKHCDFYQCGKGRDLGFGTILNFTTKIGAGMGEQLLSREYYYLGTRLRIDRFLSFYYAHPGFHLNNLFIMLSVQLFMLVLVNLGSLANESIICMYDSNIPFTDIEEPLGCQNLQPVLNWVTRFVLSVFICFFISFMPLIIQELIEKGFFKAILRMFYHFVSWAPLFEVFVCQAYAKSLRDNITFGGAKYIATGRGFATSRISFTVLYSRYATVSIYSGFTIFLIVSFACSSMWQPSLLWFWITVISMCLAPFIFNPHQFALGDFILDYREFLRWLSRGNVKGHGNSWIGFIRTNRSRFTGYKRKSYGKVNTTVNESLKKPARTTSIFDRVLIPVFSVCLYLIPYMFINAQTGVMSPRPVNPLVRIMIVSLFPILGNALVLLVLFVVSITLGPLFSLCCYKTPAVLAAAAHAFAIIITIVNLQVLFFLESWSFTRSLCGIIFMVSFQGFLLQFLLSMCLSREIVGDHSNRAWWSGKWFSNGLGWLVLTQPLREFVVKICELNLFAYDFILGHFLIISMCPLLMIPFIDKWHSSMLFWLKPSMEFRDPIYSQRLKSKRKRKIIKYSFLLVGMITIYASVIVAPFLLKDQIPDISDNVPLILLELIQPNHQNNNDTGENAPMSVLRAKPEYIPMRTVD